jgi:L-alanine-DL-glutamate epimerase-like enolase superfamily enzyme
VKIVEVRPYALNVGGRNHCLAKVALDSGAVGWGEAGLSHKERAVGAMVDVLRPLF